VQTSLGHARTANAVCARWPQFFIVCLRLQKQAFVALHTMKNAHALRGQLHLFVVPAGAENPAGFLAGLWGADSRIKRNY